MLIEPALRVSPFAKNATLSNAPLNATNPETCTLN